MSDLLQLLPDISLTTAATYTLSAIESKNITTIDLLTLNVADISTRAKVSQEQVRNLVGEVTEALQEDLEAPKAGGRAGKAVPGRCNGLEGLKNQCSLTTTDPVLDEVFGGGLPTGCIIEFVGESGAGKTNMLLPLLLTVQLPTSLGGLGRNAMYISTESQLSTKRLFQLERAFKAKFPDSDVSMDRISTAHCGDLESQDHILRYQLPVQIERMDIGIIVIDSIAANFRAESSTGASGRRDPALLAQRSRELVKVGGLLSNIAKRYNLVVVVANQVADQFRDTSGSGDVLMLDHQQRWFSGWEQQTGGKVPALGMTWVNCIGARVALYKRTIEELGDDDDVLERTKRSLKVVFAPWVEAGREVEFIIEAGGVKGIEAG